MNRHFVVIIILMILVIQTGASIKAFPEKDQPVDVLEVRGAIFTSTARYIERGIRQAEEDNAICIIQLDTPGGLISSMREIIQTISNSKVPVVIYIYPQGAMATSAGTYITYASHIAAMAPGTHIGSAHPVGIGFDNKRRRKKGEDPFDFKLPGQKEKSPAPDEKKDKDSGYKKDKKDEDSESEVDVDMEKATNAMVALIRSLAEKTGRNADWGEKAVRESVSITAKEAVKLNVVEIEAENLSDLLEKLKGRKVTLAGKVTVTLYPSQDNIKYIRMSSIERFLLTINDPQIAIILMFLGTLGLYYELANPGATLPGIIGGICIVLGLYTLGSLPINYTGLALIILSIILFVAEIFTPTFGALTLGGIISFILGAVFLIPAGTPYMEISKTLVITLATIMGIISFLVINVLVKSMRRKPVTGQEDLVGALATVKIDLAPRGMVMMKGELWKAVTEEDIIHTGKTVIVDKVDGLLLKVKEFKEDRQL